MVLIEILCSPIFVVSVKMLFCCDFYFLFIFSFCSYIAYILSIFFQLPVLPLVNAFLISTNLFRLNSILYNKMTISLSRPFRQNRFDAFFHPKNHPALTISQHWLRTLIDSSTDIVTSHIFMYFHNSKKLRFGLLLLFRLLSVFCFFTLLLVKRT